MSTVFITEKYSVAEEYAKILGINDRDKRKGFFEGPSSYLGTNVVITWARGHLIRICEPEVQNEDWQGKWTLDKLPMMPSKFKYEPIPDSISQFKVIKELYTRNDVDCIYYAGDSGREGIYIQALIRNQIFKSNPKCEEKVVWISSFSEAAIKEGIKTAKPYSAYLSMIDSGYARAISDWLIGMNFTRSVTIKNGPLIKIGRVKTPTLAMVVKRQEEIDNFKKTDYYGIKAIGNPEDKINWKASELSRFHDSELLYNESGFLKREDADKLLGELSSDNHLRTEKVDIKKDKKEYAPLLFNLTDLQSTCTKALKISPSTTLEIAQKLYQEAKLTTYPRTTSRYLDTKTQQQYAAMGYKIPDMYVNDDKVDDHFAIIPTFCGDESVSLSETEKKVYELILKRFMDTMKPPYVYDAVSVVYRHQNKEPFYENFRVVKQLGWKEKDDSDEASNKTAPNEGDIISVTFQINEMATKPPTPYTTGSLVKAMESAGKLIDDKELRENIKSSGIGTPATRGDIVKDLATPNKAGVACIEVDKSQKITPTEFGKQVIAAVKKFDESLTSPIKTAEMEDKLNAINDKELSYDDYMQIIQNYVRETTATISNAETQRMSYGSAGGGISGKCPHCGGEVAKGQYGIYCKNKCGMSFEKVYGHKLTEAQIMKLLEGKSVTYTDNGRKTTVMPSVVENPWNGKVYYNWASKSEFVNKSGGSGNYGKGKK